MITTIVTTKSIHDSAYLYSKFVAIMKKKDPCSIFKEGPMAYCAVTNDGNKVIFIASEFADLFDLPGNRVDAADLNKTLDEIKRM